MNFDPEKVGRLNDGGRDNPPQSMVLGNLESYSRRTVIAQSILSHAPEKLADFLFAETGMNFSVQ